MYLPKNASTVYPMECNIASTVTTRATHLWNLLKVEKLHPVTQSKTLLRMANAHSRGRFDTAMVPVRLAM
jgi:hypothetical protein